MAATTSSSTVRPRSAGLRGPPPVSGMSGPVGRASSARNPVRRLRESLTRPSSSTSATSAPVNSAFHSEVANGSSNCDSPKDGAADSWTAPADREGALIRATYAYFAQHPIRGDGKVSGEEVTRHNFGQFPWMEQKRANRAAVSDFDILSSVQGSVAPVNNPIGLGTEGSTASSKRISSNLRLRPTTAGTSEGLFVSNAAPGRAGSDSRAHAAVSAATLLEPHGNGKADLPITSQGNCRSLHHSTSTSFTRTSGDVPTEPGSSRSSLPLAAGPACGSDLCLDHMNAGCQGAGNEVKPEMDDKIDATSRPLDQYGFFESEAMSHVGTKNVLTLPGKVFHHTPHRPRLEAVRSDGRLGATYLSSFPHSSSERPKPSAQHSQGPSQEKQGEKAEREAREKAEREAREKAEREARWGLKRRKDLDKSHSGRDRARTLKWQQMLATVTPEGQKPSVPQASGEAAAPLQVEFKKDVSSGTLRRRVFKGIPSAWRPVVWPLLIRLKTRSDAENPNENENANTNTRWTHYQQHHRRVARSVLGTGSGSFQSPEREAEEFARVQSIPSTWDVQIDLDVPRSMNGHWAFYTRYGRGQVQLFRVLHAMSLHCSVCGFCQGMGAIGATLLLNLPSPAAAYTALTGLHDHYDLHSAFQPGLPGVRQMFFVHQRLVHAYLPSFSHALEEADIFPSSYASRWYMTLFQGIVPYATQLRIWDAYLLLGPDVLSLTALAFVWGAAHTLPLSTQPPVSGSPRSPRQRSSRLLLHPRATRIVKGSDTLLDALNSFFIVEDDDELMDWVSRMLERSHVQQRLAQAHQAWAALDARGETNTMML